MILVTLLCSSLLTSIWFYSSRGIACCTEIRTLLDTGAGAVCGAPPANVSSSSNSTLLSPYLLPSNTSSGDAGCDPAVPAGVCLGYTGACGDLPSQFSSLQGAYVYSTTLQCSSTPDDPSCICHPTLADYVCHAFPDDAYVTDQIFVGLICVAVALPVTLFLERAFETANEVDGAAEGWVTWGGLWRLALGKDAHKKWWWTNRDDPPGELVQLLAADAGYGDLAKFAAAQALRKLRQWMTPRAVIGDGGDADGKEPESPRPRDGGEDEKEEAYDDADARRGALARRAYAATGLLGVYVTWAIFSWFIFTYGAC